MFSYHKQLSCVHSCSSVLWCLHSNSTARRHTSLCQYRKVTVQCAVHSALLQRHSDTLCKVTHQAQWQNRHSDTLCKVTHQPRWQTRHSVTLCKVTHTRHGDSRHSDTLGTVTYQARWHTRYSDTVGTVTH